MNPERLDIISKRPRKKEEHNLKDTVKQFSNKKVELEQAPFFFPPGYENIFLTLYFVTLPYITGLIFLFVYVAKSKVDTFLLVSEKASFLIVWAIGYEVLAAIFFIYIFKLFINALNAKKHSGKFNQKFRRP